MSLQDPLGVSSLCAILSANPAASQSREKGSCCYFPVCDFNPCVNIPSPEACLGNEDVENLPSSSYQAGYVKKMLVTTKKSRKAAAGAGIEDGGLWSLPPFLLVGVEVRGGGGFNEHTKMQVWGEGDP